MFRAFARPDVAVAYRLPVASSWTLSIAWRASCEAVSVACRAVSVTACVPSRRRLLNLFDCLACRLLEVLGHLSTGLHQVVLEWLCLVHQLIGGTALLFRRREDGGQQHTDPHRDGTGGERVALGLLADRVGRLLERGDGATRRVSDAAGGVGDGAATEDPVSDTVPMTRSRTVCNPLRIRFLRRSIIRPGLSRSPIASSVSPRSPRVYSISRLSCSALWPIPRPP